MKIILGTANFSNQYGHRQVKARDINQILDTALDLGINTIETAHDYNCLDAFKNHVEMFDFIYKCDTIGQKKEAMDKLGYYSAEHDVTFMKHHPPYYDGWDGVSVYNPSTPSGEDVKMVEFPYNIVDQRFGGIINSVLESIARSVFIQGLAFSMPDFHGIPFYHLCWNFVRNNPNIDAIVVGVDSAEQLEDILNIPQYEIDYSKIGSDGWIKRL